MAEPDRAVLFDVDGTLVGTKSLYLEAYRVAVQSYVRKELTAEDIMALRPTSEIAFLRAVVSEADFDACLEEFHGAYRRLHETMFEGVYDGIPELLDGLRSAGVPLGLVTGKSRRSWETTSAVIALGPFDVLVFDDDVRAPKPDPHGLELAVERLGCDRASSFYVGDTVTDMRAARAAGLQPVAALWARSGEGRRAYADRLAAEGARLVERPGDVADLLGIAGQD